MDIFVFFVGATIGLAVGLLIGANNAKLVKENAGLVKDKINEKLN